MPPSPPYKRNQYKKRVELIFDLSCNNIFDLSNSLLDNSRLFSSRQCAQSTRQFVTIGQIADLVLFPCGDAAASITGSAMPIVRHQLLLDQPAGKRGPGRAQGRCWSAIRFSRPGS